MIDISILICTYRRDQIARTLESIFEQTLNASAKIEIIVADNDASPTAHHIIEKISQTSPVELRYLHAPAKNISIARNACLDHCQGEWIAFIDDDEVADPTWLETLLETARVTGADAVFGPAIALYPEGAPEWIRKLDFHSNHPVRRNGVVMTGHTCNAALRWRGTAWQHLRFDLERGQTGGEDTAFFFAIHHAGARMEIAENAKVYEKADPARLSFKWIVQRSFRSGQSYVSAAGSLLARITLAGSALFKCLISLIIAPLVIGDNARAHFWVTRAIFHAGVFAGCVSVPHLREYG